MPIKNKVVYVIHYSKLRDRHRRILEAFEKSDYRIEWITEKNFQKSFHTNADSKKVYGISKSLIGMDLGINSRSLVFSRKRAQIQGWVLLVRAYLQRRISLTRGSLPSGEKLANAWLEVQQMHITALRKGVENGADWILVLEDDAVLSRNFFSSIEWVKQNYNSSEKIWINLNSAAELKHTKSDPKPDKFGFFRLKPAVTRATVAYMVSAPLAIGMVGLVQKEGLPDWMPIDYVYQVMLRSLQAKSFWQDPPSVIQGSEAGIFKSGFDSLRQLS